MKIREERLTGGSYMTTLHPVQFANHRRRLLHLTPLWNALWELVNCRITSAEELAQLDLEQSQGIMNALYVLAMCIDTDALTENDYIKLHPVFKVLQAEQIAQPLQTLFLRKPTTLAQLEFRFNKIINDHGKLNKVIQIITWLQKTLHKSAECYAFERASRNRRKTINTFLDSLKAQHDAFYVMRLTLLYSPIARLQGTDKSSDMAMNLNNVKEIDIARKALCQALSRRQRICKNKIGYLWTLQHDMDIGMHVNVTLLFPATEQHHSDTHVDSIATLMARYQLTVGVQSPLDKHTVVKGNRASGDVIHIDEPKHATAISKLLEEYCLESRFMRLNLPQHIKSSGISLTR